jgi:hypothetical protein
LEKKEGKIRGGKEKKHKKKRRERESERESSGLKIIA